jgi:hypothetical protein
VQQHQVAYGARTAGQVIRHEESIADFEFPPNEACV